MSKSGIISLTSQLLGFFLVVSITGCDKAPEQSAATISSAPQPFPSAASPSAVAESVDERSSRLVKQLHDPDPLLRMAAANQLGELAASGALPDGPLQQLINAYDMDENPEVISAVVFAMGKTCHPAPMEMLIRSLKGDLQRVRGSTLIVLGEIGNFPAAEALDAFALRLKDDSSPETQALVLQAQEARQKIMRRAGRRAECQPPASQEEPPLAPPLEPVTR